MPEILQSRLPVAPWMAEHTLRLPGTVPIPPADWLQRDDAFGAQMARRDRLIAGHPTAVHAMADGCRPAAEELLALVLTQLAETPGYRRKGTTMRRPDGVAVPLGGPPLVAAGRLVQEDLLILDKPEAADEHALQGGIVCFPSNWTLAEKMGKPLSRIHAPVERYDATVARRVQRLLDALRPEAPLMRSNLLFYAEPELFNPRPEFEPHGTAAGTARYLRVERQALLRLPRTRAVVFSIHTYLVRPEALEADQRARLEALRPGAFAEAGA
jgi:hypothetical protein